MNLRNAKDSNVKMCVKIANKILLEGTKLQYCIDKFFYGESDFKTVLGLISFDEDASLPPHVLASTVRPSSVTEPVDYKISINFRFKKQFKNSGTSDECNRLRFILAVAISHETFHLSLRHNKILQTPVKLLGYRTAEAGEFFEKELLGGIVSMRLSGRKRSWDPKTMRVLAVVLKLHPHAFRVICDEVIKTLISCSIESTPLPNDFFPMATVKSGRPKNQHTLKRSDGAHEGTRSSTLGKRHICFEDEDSHILYSQCPISFSRCRHA
jgi:hypothetical protein